MIENAGNPLLIFNSWNRNLNLCEFSQIDSGLCGDVGTLLELVLEAERSSEMSQVPRIHFRSRSDYGNASLDSELLALGNHSDAPECTNNSNKNVVLLDLILGMNLLLVA